MMIYSAARPVSPLAPSLGNRPTWPAFHIEGVRGNRRMPSRSARRTRRAQAANPAFDYRPTL
eukprot:13269959-Alexandrium_andersonii.AAC.1